MKFIEHLIEKEKTLVKSIELLNIKLKLIQDLIEVDKLNMSDISFEKKGKDRINEVLSDVRENKKSISTKKDFRNTIKLLHPRMLNINYILSKLEKSGEVIVKGENITWLEK